MREEEYYYYKRKNKKMNSHLFLSGNDAPLYSPQPKNQSPPLDQIQLGPPNIGPNQPSTSNYNHIPGPSFFQGSSSSVAQHPIINLPTSTNFTPSNSIIIATTTTTNNNNNNNNYNNSNPPPATMSSSTFNNDHSSSNNARTQQQHQQHNQQQEKSDGVGKIPKKVTNTTASDKYDDMSMLVLQERYRESENRLEDLRKKRLDIERALNDMARSSQGKNIEFDPLFRQKKDEQRQCDEAVQEQRAKMKKVADKLWTKFGHKIVPKYGERRPISNKRPTIKRAKMSTAAAINKPRDALDMSKDAMARLIFKMGESRLWCKLCDSHFDSFSMYCDHLHSREHTRNTKRSDPPWRKTKDKIDIRQTLDIIEAICLKVSKEVGEEFSTAKMTKILCPTGINEEKLRKMALSRDKGIHDPIDPLLHIKGYENLIPINGFFCQLCDRAYCDVQSIEQHVKSYEHNYRHALSLANDEMSEKTFRDLQEKSFKKQNPDRPSLSYYVPHESPKKTSAPPASSSTSQISRERTKAGSNPPPVSYKKLTSHIVDQHEAVVEKFPDGGRTEKREAYKPPKTTATASSKSKRVQDNTDDEISPLRELPSESSEVTKTFIRNRVPDIVPIQDSRSRPAALKRLKQRERPPKPPSEPTKSSEEKEKRREYACIAILESDSSDSDETPELEKASLGLYDPDSPFPHLELTVTGNTHNNVLKDQRLAQPCVVKMNRINPADYRDMLMDETDLWTRISNLMTKKESEGLNKLSKQIREKPKTMPTYFTASGESIPIDLADDEKNDDLDVEEKPKLPINSNSGGGNDVDNNDTDDEENSKVSSKNRKRSTDEDDEEEAGSSVGGDRRGEKILNNGNGNGKEDEDEEENRSDPKRFHMGWLDQFFCDK